MRRSKFLYLGLPFILLVSYLVWVPSPSVNKIFVQGDLAYIAEGFEFTIVRLTPRDRITRLSSVNLAYTVKDLTVTERYAYAITSDGKIHIIDIGNPSSPKRLIQFSTPGIPKSIAADGSTIYIADYQDGIRILNVDNPLRPSEKGAILDIDDSLDIDVTGNLVYVARGNQGLEIYDTSNLAEPRRLIRYEAGGNIDKITIQKTTTPEGQELIRGILIIEKRVVQIVDFTNAQQPTLLNSFDFDAAEIEQALIVDKRLFTAQRRTGLMISGIKENGKLEPLANIKASRTTLGAALMDNTVYITTGFEGLRVFDITKLNNIYPVGTGYSRFWDHKIQIGFLTIGFLVIWMAFFAQFVLPVRTTGQRSKIFVRLIIFLLGRHGPAIFIENGRKIEGAGESEKKGPGVVLLDTASAAVIRTATKFKEAIGPGVHFTKKGESLAGFVDLHTQVDSLGPSEGDKPFEKQADDQSNEAYKEIQNRRKMTSALTRDGIEVVPNIRVVFRVDTQPAQGDEAGSRFGYRTGISLIDKNNEKKDKEAIFKAIAGEGIDPTAPDNTPDHRIAWNQLPGRLAVDVWRDYVAKFTLDELFTPTQEAQLESALELEPKPEEIEAIKHPLHVGADSKTRWSGIADILSVFNQYIAGLADWIAGKTASNTGKPSVNIAPKRTSFATHNTDSMKRTALQVIADMVKRRLTQARMEQLDNTGIPTGGTIDSREFDLLSKRGLKVLSVSISNLRFKEAVELYLIDQWSANWYSNAKAERERIERRRRYIEISGEEDGANEYLHALARHIVLQKPKSTAETLRALLMRTRLTIVRNDQLQSRMSSERQDIEEILQWVEDNS